MADTPYGTRDLVYVKPTAAAAFRYGFYTNSDAASRAVLGQTAALVNGAYVPGLVLGANAPKPPRVQKLRTGGKTDSTFCSIDKVDDAKAAGWKQISRAKKRRGAVSARSKAVYIEIGTPEVDGGEAATQIRYAWRMPNFLYEKITAADKTALGIADATAAIDNLVWGARYPAPPRVVFIAVGTDSIGSRSTFCDPKKLDSLPTGWKPADLSDYE